MKRIVSGILSVLLLAGGVLPLQIYAQDEPEETPDPVIQETDTGTEMREDTGTMPSESAEDEESETEETEQISDEPDPASEEDPAVKEEAESETRPAETDAEIPESGSMPEDVPEDVSETTEEEAGGELTDDVVAPDETPAGEIIFISDGDEWIEVGPEYFAFLEEEEYPENAEELYGAPSNIRLTVTYGQTDARSMLTMINDFRTGSDAWYWDKTNTKKIKTTGLKALTYDYGLEKIAMLRAAEIAVRMHPKHYRPNDKASSTAYQTCGLVHKTPSGENISGGYNSTFAAFNAWREDSEYYSGQGHRRNMLNSNYKYVGIGHAVYQGRHYWVQEFNGNQYSSSWTAANNNDTSVAVEISDSIITNRTCTAEGDLPDKMSKGSSVSLPVIRETMSVEDHWPSGKPVITDAVNAAWTSGNTGVAVIANGKLTAKGSGTATITAKYGNWSRSWQVSVSCEPERVTLDRSTLTVKAGETVTLKATVLPSDADDKTVNWYSSNSSVASVDSTGAVRGLKPGTATITVTTVTGSKSASCKVTVTGNEYPVTGVSLNKTSLSLTKGKSETLIATVNPSYASDKAVTWSTGNAKVASVDSSGKVTAKAAGTAVITVTTKDGGKTATCRVTVTESKGSSGCRLNGFCRIKGKDYWYENGNRQAVKGDPKNLIDTRYHVERGREIYDPETNAWYWLDAAYGGAKAVGKEVWMPYIYQDEDKWSLANKFRIAYESDTGMGLCVYNAIVNKDGKWVRYDQNGKMLKGWVTISGELAKLYPKQKGNTYYYDSRTGLMAKGYVTIKGVQYHFDDVTGVLDR